MKLPNIVASTLIVGAMAIIQHLTLHLGEFHLPELYAPVALAVLAAIGKALQEANPPEPPATLARGMVDEKQHGFWTRVLLK